MRRQSLEKTKYRAIYPLHACINLFLVLPQLGVQYLDPRQRHHLADGVDLVLACIHERPYRRIYLVSRHDEHKPDPAVERAHHLTRGDAARAHQPAENRRQRPRADVDARAKCPPGQRARHVIHKAAARDVRHGFDELVACRREHLPRVDRRRGEQRAAERRRCRAGGVIVPRARGSVGRAGAREHRPHEGEAVRVQAGGRQAEQDVAWADVVPREELRALNGADCKTCEIVVSCGGQQGAY